jgi:NCS1 family nucleobase:cation symporter-1
MSEAEQIERDDGRVELAEDVVLSDPALFNEDLAPTRIAKRTWTTYTFAALWISMAHCIPTYMLASGLISAGMNWWQALVTILVGNTIVLVPILANSHPGTKYGIPFPVFARASYGVFGANVPAIMRAIVACGWFGINAWIGGQALQTFFASLWRGWPALLGDKMEGPIFGGHHLTEFVSFALFWGLNILVVYKGMELVRKVENIAAPYVLVMTALLVIWAVKRASDIEAEANGGEWHLSLGGVMRDAGKFQTFGAWWPVFVPSVTAMIGFWSTLSLNMPDFTRFGRSQKEQTIGQVVALPTTMTVFSLMGIVITSASAVIYQKAIWDPIELVGKFESRLLVAIAMFTVVVATLGVNIAANVVSPANDFANIKPGAISFRTGGLITGVVGVLMLPWKLIADPNGYIFKWLLGYSGGLGSIAGVLVCDYWFVRKKRLALADLYRRDGEYAYGPRTGSATTTTERAGGGAYREGEAPAGERAVYTGSGFHVPGIAATLVGCALAWIGLVVKPLAVLYDYAWFVGAGGAAGAYWLMTASLRNKPAP